MKITLFSTNLASSRRGVDPHLASREAIIDLELLDLQKDWWTNERRVNKVATVVHITCRKSEGVLNHLTRKSMQSETSANLLNNFVGDYKFSSLQYVR